MTTGAIFLFTASLNIWANDRDIFCLMEMPLIMIHKIYTSLGVRYLISFGLDMSYVLNPESIKRYELKQGTFITRCKIKVDRKYL